MTHAGNGRATFTPARLEALKADWEAGLDAEEIKQRLNALPGPPVRNRKFIQQKASAIGLKRPEGWLMKRKRRPRHNIWTADRLELLRNLINLLPDADVLERANALPGPELKNLESMRRRAQRMGYLAAKPLKPGPEHTTWTDERLELLRQCYGRLPSAELLAALNAMPGAHIASIDIARKAAFRAGIKSAGLVRTPPAPRASRAPRPAKSRPTFAQSEPEPEPAPLTPEEQEARVAEMLAAREATAFKMFAARRDAHAVSAALKIPLWQACRLQGVYRQQNQEAA